MRNHAYYLIKPYLPWGLRTAARRWQAKHVWKRHPEWPILNSAKHPPANWRGWPPGKDFAFVATHDVEGASGLARVRRLAELEISLGFRSVFNFIPEGSYSVPAELRHWLTDNGFEIGVHDLKHDGKLYDTHARFVRNAKQINLHLQDWGARGFRSGFMLHNLEWLHELQVEYDTSTFDVDPFEPQPDGVGTIFPFIVTRGIPQLGQFDPTLLEAEKYYVELPYTLPQDSTLFLVLCERNTSIWRQKLEWIRSQRGMALVNVHPDYLRFSDEPVDARTYPVEYYSDLLKSVAEYRDSVWRPLPNELVAWYKEVHSLPLLKKTSCPNASR